MKYSIRRISEKNFSIVEDTNKQTVLYNIEKIEVAMDILAMLEEAYEKGFEDGKEINL